MSFEALHTIDKCVLLTLNGSNNLFLDNLVVTLTSAYTWILLYGALLYLVIKNNENWWKIMLIVGTIGIGLLIVDGVNLGIVKPLIARPRPLNSPELQGIVQSANGYYASGYSFNKIKRVLIRDGVEISLTKKELAFISLLIKRLGTLVLHDEIKSVVWVGESVTEAAIRTFVKRVRDKVGNNFIKNVPGLGYKIDRRLS